MAFRLSSGSEPCSIRWHLPSTQLTGSPVHPPLELQKQCSEGRFLEEPGCHGTADTPQAVSTGGQVPAGAVLGATGLPRKADPGLQPPRWGQRGTAGGEPESAPLARARQAQLSGPWCRLAA